MVDVGDPTEDEAAALKARPWIARLDTDFGNGLVHGGMVSIILDNLVPAPFNEAAFTVIAQQILNWAWRKLPAPDQRGEPFDLSKMFESKGVRESFDAGYAEYVRKMRADETFGPMWRYVTQAGLVRAWAALEAMTEDLWVGALNSAGKRFRQQAFQAVAKATEEGQGLNKKSVDIGLLAKYDFNLQDKLGTVLAPKFSFKTVAGMAAAYSAAFGFEEARPAPSFPTPNDLKPIEAKRHVIVHRGGIIDGEYASKAALSPEFIGKALEVDRATVMHHVDEIYNQGTILLRQTATWLQAVDPVTPTAGAS